ncbi:MAG: acyl-CoA thioesterase [Planctomyces sp.]|nr:acyl-CoA thioesterase [Planctomyces sp.]
MEVVTYQIPIYPYQIDFMRHVSNIAYIQWMEIGRCLLLDEIGMSVATIAKQGFGPVLVETQISYKMPLHLGDTVTGKIWISELNNVSAWMEFEFAKQDGLVAATGRQRGLFVDLETNRPRRLSPAQRLLFEPFVEVSPRN